MIQINNIKEKPVQLWNEHGYVGVIETYLQLLDVRLQIRLAKAQKYRMLFQGEWVYIDSNGKLDHVPEGLFDKVNKYLRQLL